LELRLSNVNESAQRDETITAYLGQVESVFDPNQSGLQDAISGFFNSFSVLANDAASAPLRYSVVAAGQGLATSIRDAANQLLEIRRQADLAANETVSQINSLTAKIARLNAEIGVSEGPNVTANALRDDRAEALNQLSALIDVNYFESSDGSVTVATDGGQPLVPGGFAQSLTFQQSPATGYGQIYAGAIDITSTIKGGKLGGLIEVRDRLVPAYQSDLDTLAERIVSQVNAVHQAGKDLQVPPTSPAVAFFTPVATVAGAARIFSVNAPIASDVRNIAAGQSGAPGDNANALAIANLANTKLLAGGTQTFTDNLTALQSRIGVDAQSAAERLDANHAMLTQLQNSRDQISAVSLDEEAVDLIRFQRAYEAAAKFISVVDELTATLIEQLGS
jgi:flagellar hook-associated protein 1 FlgK